MGGPPHAGLHTCPQAQPATASASCSFGQVSALRPSGVQADGGPLQTSLRPGHKVWGQGEGRGPTPSPGPHPTSQSSLAPRR